VIDQISLTRDTGNNGTTMISTGCLGERICAGKSNAVAEKSSQDFCTREFHQRTAIYRRWFDIWNMS
jgi:hypothetical protein